MRLLDRLSASLAPAADDDQMVAAAPAQRVRSILRRFWPFARPYRKRWLVGLALAAALPAIEAVEIWLFKSVVDDVLVPADLASLWPLAAAMASLALVGALLSFGDEYIATWVGERFTLSVRAKVFDHLQRLEPDALDKRRHGDVLSRLSGDLHAIETLLLSALAEAVQAAARLLFFVGALFLLSWKLALASLVVIPPLWLAARAFGRLARRAARERRRRSGTVGAVLEEALANTALVQTANAQGREQARLKREAEGASEAELAGMRVAGLFAPVIDMIELAGAILILALGTWALSSGDLTLGGLLAFLAYLSQLYRPLRDLTRLYTSVFEATAGAERVMELLDTQPRVVERAHARELTRATGRLELRGVHFSYDRQALAGASLVVPPGRFVALTGASGAGKSTRGQARRALPGPRRRHGPSRRARRPRPHARVAAPQRRAPAAGRAADRRDDRRQRRLRASGGQRGRCPPRARGHGPRPRPRHARRPEGPRALRRAAAAGRDGPRAAAGRARADPRRAHRRPRRRGRAGSSSRRCAPSRATGPRS